MGSDLGVAQCGAEVQSGLGIVPHPDPLDISPLRYHSELRQGEGTMSLAFLRTLNSYVFSSSRVVYERGTWGYPPEFSSSWGGSRGATKPSPCRRESRTKRPYLCTGYTTPRLTQ
jgi:hypothetical protein